MIVKGQPDSRRIKKTGKKIGKNNNDLLIKRAACEFCDGPLQRFCFVGDQDYAGADLNNGISRIKALNNQE